MSQQLPTEHRCYRVMVLTTIILFLILSAGIWHLGSNLMMGCGWFGAFLLHAGTRLTRRKLLAVILTGSGFTCIYALHRGPFHADPLLLIMGLGAFLGMGSIVVLSYEIVWSGILRNKDTLRNALILPGFSLLAGLVMGPVNGHNRYSYDYLLYAFDSALGVTPGLDITNLFDAQPWIQAVSSGIYSLVLLFPPLFQAWAAYKNRQMRINLMYAVVVAGVLGFILYQVCPAMGPLYAFPEAWPKHLPASVPLREIATVSANNAMPSVHMTWALLVWWAALNMGPRAIGIATMFVGFTALATMGLGEHYLIDLVVAVPVVMATEGILTKKHWLTLTGIALALSWASLLRFGTLLALPIIANWTLVVFTIVTAIVLMGQQRNWIRIGASPLLLKPVIHPETL